MKNKNKGLKFDNNKSRIDLIPSFVILEIGDILNFGLKKYKFDSWKNVENGQNRYYAAAMRHLLQWKDGELNDKESGLSHLVHALVNIIFCRYFEKRGLK